MNPKIILSQPKGVRKAGIVCICSRQYVLEVYIFKRTMYMYFSLFHVYNTSGMREGSETKKEPDYTIYTGDY